MPNFWKSEEVFHLYWTSVMRLSVSVFSEKPTVNWTPLTGAAFLQTGRQNATIKKRKSAVLLNGSPNPILGKETIHKVVEIILIQDYEAHLLLLLKSLQAFWARQIGFDRRDYSEIEGI